MGPWSPIFPVPPWSLIFPMTLQNGIPTPSSPCLSKIVSPYLLPCASVVPCCSPIDDPLALEDTGVFECILSILDLSPLVPPPSSDQIPQTIPKGSSEPAAAPKSPHPQSSASQTPHRGDSGDSAINTTSFTPLKSGPQHSYTVAEHLGSCTGVL